MKPKDILILLILARAQPAELTGRVIAQRSGLYYGTVYCRTRRLREKGFVEWRNDHDEDGPLRFFKLTPAGMAEIARIER